MKRIHKLCAALISILLLFTLLPVPAHAAAPAFIDVPADAWYAEPVREAVERGLFAGTSAMSFSPSKPLDRKMLAVLLWRLGGTQTPYIRPEDTGFRDLSAKSYACSAVLWCYENGILSGRSAVAYAGAEAVTRQELITALQRFCQVLELRLPQHRDAAAAEFLDWSQVADYAAEAVSFGVQTHLLSGSPAKGGRVLRPADPITRAEAAAVLTRFLNAVQPPEHQHVFTLLELDPAFRCRVDDGGCPAYWYRCAYPDCSARSTERFYSSSFDGLAALCLAQAQGSVNQAIALMCALCDEAGAGADSTAVSALAQRKSWFWRAASLAARNPPEPAQRKQVRTAADYHLQHPRARDARLAAADAAYARSASEATYGFAGRCTIPALSIDIPLRSPADGLSAQACVNGKGGVLLYYGQHPVVGEHCNQSGFGALAQAQPDTVAYLSTASGTGRWLCAANVTAWNNGTDFLDDDGLSYRYRYDSALYIYCCRTDAADGIYLTVWYQVD